MNNLKVKFEKNEAEQQGRFQLYAYTNEEIEALSTVFIVDTLKPDGMAIEVDLDDMVISSWVRSARTVMKNYQKLPPGYKVSFEVVV